MQTIRTEGEIVEAEASYLRPFFEATSPKDVPAAFARHIQQMGDFLATLPEAKVDFAYAPGKWTLRQVVAHILDAHVIFQYRALCIARGDTQTLLPFDENLYAAFWSSTSKSRTSESHPSATLAQLAQAYRDVSRATATLSAFLTPEAWARRGIANRIRISPELLYRVIMGHESHHGRVLQERYLSP